MNSPEVHILYLSYYFLMKVMADDEVTHSNSEDIRAEKAKCDLKVEKCNSNYFLSYSVHHTVLCTAILSHSL